MRSLCVAVGLALASSSALAADFGIGVSARSDDGMLYLPVNISKAFRIEPSVRYSSNESSIRQYGYEDSQETDILELGLGIFGLKKITDAAHLYYGGRVSYVDSEATNLTPGPYGEFINGKTKQDGYRIGPTLGFEYLFAGHFSVGGEASYTFLDLDGEATTYYNTSYSSKVQMEQKTHGTQTRLVFRYMF